ncbi:hypothetical protein U9M48_020718 [Paspalum notatum var. saurae]|uniref:Uncharacterized protein n=1 Tax=Paspalum notatum var. saurae TaxID=547442 RepID=A0AAQ3WSC0_PASNO
MPAPRTRARRCGLNLVRSAPMAWRRRYIKHLLLVAPLPAEGFLAPVKNFVSGPKVLYVPAVDPLALKPRPMWRTFESAIVNFPSPEVFGRRPLVVRLSLTTLLKSHSLNSLTERRNCSAYDIDDLLVAVGYGRGGVEPFWRRAVPKMWCSEAPMVPTTCINGVGNDTPEQLVYWDADFDKDPEVVYGDGDDTINLVSGLAFDDKMRQQPAQTRCTSPSCWMGLRTVTSLLLIGR